MTETDGTSTCVAGDSSPAPTRVVSSVVKVGERTKFTVELRPGETTIVSWKKLTKDAAKSECGVETTAPSVVATAAAPTTVAAASEIHAAALDARVAPGGPVSNEDAPAPNRFSAVIEKIERLYKGKDSSDEEDLDDIPDDDQYDTEDSFIDDAELDEYFQVDKSKTKHDGYFVNRGMLEKVIESPELPNQQPKKRRRKEMAKVAGNNDDGLHPSKHMKALKEGTGKYLSNEKGVLPISEGSSVKYFEETKIHNHQKIADDGKPLLDPTLRIPHDDGSLTLAEISDNQKADIFPDKHLSSKLKEVNGNGDRIESKHKAHSVINNYEESEIAVHQKDNSPMREKIDLNLPDTKHSVQPVKSSVTHKKESSSAKSKVNVLEKAIRELEKMVAESRPPALDAQDGDSSSLCIKRRLPREIKHKLAKVARLAHASNGNVSNELLNRLMGIVGHLCQVRTLKRHLKIMVTTSLSAKQEKDEKFQVIKEEVVKMVNACVPSGIYKATEQQSGGSGDLQESSEKAATGQLFMNASLEDKICDLYDIFVDGLDEDAAPQVRKLYAELAELWPKGFMDNHGIKLAICRAKERRRTLVDTNKDHEKIKRKKLVATNTENTVNVESNLAAPSQYLNMNVTTDPSITAVTHQFSSTSFKVQAFTSLTNVPISHRPNQEKVTVTHPSSLWRFTFTPMVGNWKRMQNSTPNPLRNLEKANLGGVIFGCTDKTIDECLSKQLFGLPAQHFGYVKNIDPGLPLFLLNYSRREIHGIYEAASPGQLNFNPYGWTIDGSERTPYPAQVLIRTRKNCRPLLENQFSPIIKGNYYTDKHFQFELDHVQVNKLIALFSAQVVATSPAMISITRNSKKLNLQPHRLQNGESVGVMSSNALVDSSSCNESNEQLGLSTWHEEMLQDQRNDMGANSKNEVEVMYEKLQQLALNSESSNSIPVTQVHESLDTNAVNFEGGDSQEKQIAEEDNVNDSPRLPSDDPSTIAQLMLEVRELKAFKQESIDKMERLEHKLHILESMLLSQGHDNRTLMSLPGNAETFTPGTEVESCNDQLLDSDDIIFLAGGNDGNSWLASLESYCPSKDIIKPLCPMSSSRSYTSLARLNDNIYVIGGGPGGPDGLWYDTVERYSPMYNDWTSIACLNERKGSLAAVTLHDKIFALGGGNGVESFSDVEMFDLDIGRWISARTMLQKRFALAAVELNGALYAVGGFDGKDYLSSAERFDPREHSWSRLGSMNSKRGCHATVVLNEKLYAVGGFDGTSMVGSVEVFDPRLGTWIVDAPMKYQRGYGTVAVVNNNIYAIGGLDASQNIGDKVERYEEGHGWEVTNLKAIGKRCFASAIV